jgi:S1-C subfamily serine protease
MRLNRLPALAAALCGAWTALIANLAMALQPTEVFEKVSPSVWVVRALDASERPFGQGSAVVIGPGRLITNCHVLAKAVSVQVRRDNVTYEARLEHADAGRDLCLLQVARFDAPAVEMAKVDELKVGQRVYAIGNPQGMEATLSEGLISGLRTVFENPHLEKASSEVIQTTAPISPGSSGGGLFDDQGRLVGITTLIRRDAQNINIALPADWIALVPERAQAALAKRNAPRTAGTSLASTGAPGLPPAGTQWVYGHVDRQYGGRKTDVTVRVARVDGTVIEETLTSNAQSAAIARRVIDATDAQFLEHPLNAGAAMVELAPYLLAANSDRPPTDVTGLGGYPHGESTFPRWLYRSSVKDWEEVSVPAGSYRALRIEVHGERAPGSFAISSPMTGRFHLIAWYAPEVQRYVKLEHKAWSGTYATRGQQAGHDVVELISYRPPN